MDDAPPPYGSSYHQYIRDSTKWKEPVLPLIANDYVHQHSVYITAIAFQDNVSRSTDDRSKIEESGKTFLTWRPRPSLHPDSLHTAPITGPISVEHLQMIKGFEDCGASDLSSQDIVGVEDVRSMLCAQLACRLRYNESGSSLLNNLCESVDEAVAQQQSDTAANAKPRLRSDYIDALGLGKKNDSGDNSPSAVHVYKIYVYSRYATGLTNPETAEEVSLLFRWAKPESIYGRLYGFWDTSLVNALNDAAFRAGRQLSILVRGVSAQQMKTLQEKWHTGCSVIEI